ncbi:serine hydrolase [Marinilongibacter aquaticus]|uniref:glycoside hydrolase family 3 N-terminal domain-containing protein n=1 Tax=Marinilongibacter aquaticus TaxID=2975157 RepID=UPI0021BD5C3D|nr:glycoside hydrolase family 3 N-terminal domain-containing protein [Marinilongibacter aquaticus]UBM57222.1 serine hydrolase [Marinilongibacter aquaticus]
MTNKARLALLMASVFAFLVSFGFLPKNNHAHNPLATSDTNRQIFWADSVLQSMSLEEKIGQLFMISTYSNRNESHYSDIEEKIKKYHIGGLIFFQGDPETQAKLTNRYQAKSSVPMLIGIDAEWGLGMRLENTVSFPKQITLGAIDDANLIMEMGEEIGRQCRRMGIHINFAPVADVNTNPENPVINYRSFGESKDWVAEKASAYATGLQNMHVMAVAKHFPGHGDTDTDSHVALPVVRHTKKRLYEQELLPFKTLINKGIRGIMIGHLYVPAFESRSNTPATVSKSIVTDLLQKEMLFDGLTFTDAMNMRGITRQFSAGQAEVEAYKAGNDVLLQTSHLEEAFAKLKSGFEEGELKIEELDKHVLKILMAKYQSGLSNYQPIELEGLGEYLNDIRSSKLKLKLYRDAVTTVRSEKDLIPLKYLDTLKIASVTVSASDDNSLQEEFLKYAPIAKFSIPKPSSSKDWRDIVEQADQYNLMIVSVHDMNSLRRRNFGVSPSTIDFIEALSKKTHVIVCTFGNPYGLMLYDKFPNLICGYEDQPEAYQALAEVLFGGLSSQGKLPVTASRKAQFDSGVLTAELSRLIEDEPYKVGMYASRLERIDTIVANAIKQHTFPGCQVLVAKSGRVIFNRAYGNRRYGFDEPVSTETLYDLASMTKVSATLQAVMILNERGWLDLNLKASDYLPELKGTNKENMVIADILEHQAGLRSFEAYWTHTKDKGRFLPEYYESKPTENNLQVADGLYIKRKIRDDVWKWIIESKLSTRKDSHGGYRYLYSDLGLITMQKIVERITGQTLDQFVEQNIYQPLGMWHTLFNPLKKFKKEQIAPTEQDNIFRERQVWGTVHDPNAALLGGVAGHAGLFSNTWDLAKLYDMNMMNGWYGERQYLFPETVSHFATNFTKKSHRGIGWDKPKSGDERSDMSDMASASTFGHTGFTGTVVWVDPDNELIFIMLSNRVYPRSDNNRISQLKIRRLVHDAVYSALKEPS